MRAWKNYLLQRKYRNILEEFRRKSYQKTIKKYIENRMEIFNDIIISNDPEHYNY